MDIPVKQQGRRKLSPKPWTPKEDARLTELYQHHKLADIAQLMGRTISSVANRRHTLGLERTPEQQARIGDGRFTKGSSPWNRGKAGWQAGGRSTETQFKKGNSPSNTWRPIGAERTTKDGILFRKVSDTGVKRADWRAVHVMSWEAVNGPVPGGHFLVCKDGNRDNRDAENWEPVTRAENMRRNTIQRYGPEYQSLAITLGYLKSKIKEVEKCKQ